MFRHAASLPRAVGSVFRRLDARDGVAANLDKRRSVYRTEILDQLKGRRSTSRGIASRAAVVVWLRYVAEDVRPADDSVIGRKLADGDRKRRDCYFVAMHLKS